MRSLLHSWILTFVSATAAFAQMQPTSDFPYPHRMLPDPEGSYDPDIPSPEQTLGFPVGERAAFPRETMAVFEAMAGASPKAQIFEYARTHEGRPAIYMAISSEANIADLDTIKAGMARLADPRGLDTDLAEEMLGEQVVTAWLAYSIHGDETSGSDAAMLVAYHLIASQSEEVEAWLDDMVILIDPMQNPDGRNRFLSQIEQHRAAAPNVDDQSLLHAGYWPWGRTNHYLFDLNRDWILGVNPEPRGRIVESRLWYPLLFVDAHEMGAQDTYLFSPDTEPLNDNFPEYLAEWQEAFGQDQAAAFDQRGWTYYNGEWADNWYPGYGSSWGKLIGAVAILYEQSGFAEDGVRRPEGTVITYPEAVHHQAVSSWTNLRTLHRNRDALLRGFLDDRRAIVSSSGPYANRSWAILPTANESRKASFLDKLDLQGIEWSIAEESFSAGPGRDVLGRDFGSREIPAGSILISNRQPNARVAAAILEFDPQLSEQILQKERGEVLKSGSGVMYDVTAWNVILNHGLEAVELDTDLDPGRLPSAEAGEQSGEGEAEAGEQSGEGEAEAGEQSGEGEEVAASSVGYIVEGADDASLAFAARLMEQGVWVRSAERPFQLDGVEFGRGSIVVQNTDNRDCGDSIPEVMQPGHNDEVPPDCDLLNLITSTADGLGLDVHSVGTGQGPGDLPDLGGEHFKLLERPQIALIARDGVSSYSFGSIWHTIDTRLGIRHTHLNGDNVTRPDLRRYNVIVLPSKSQWDEDVTEMLKPWVENGGTLIAVGQSSFALADEDLDLSNVRLLRDVLGDLDHYEVAVHRDWQAVEKIIPEPGEVFAHSPGGEGPVAWDPEYERADSTEILREDSWRRLFMPAGAPLINARTNPHHWLTFGLGETTPVLFNGSKVLMAKSNVQSAVRAGVLTASSGVEQNGPASEQTPLERVGWSSLPSGQEIYIRASGLLWPEAAHRIANAPLLTREQAGKGQIILFAFEPTFRGSTQDGIRMLLNAVVLGPGLGTDGTITP